MNLQIHEEASEWVVKHRDGGLSAQEGKSFDAWLRESPQHVRAYLELSSVWEDVPALDPTWNPDAVELIAQARRDDSVVSLASLSPSGRRTPSVAQETDNEPRDGETRRSKPGASSSAQDEASALPTLRPIREEGVRLPAKAGTFYALAASILVLLVGGWFYLQRGVYATETGEQRSLVLADGSTVELNSRSRIRVEYRRHERRIDLLEGQALFHVAKNSARPFIVESGNTQVRAVGTAFDVYRTSSGAVVTVVEGRVAVRTSPESQGASGELPHEASASPDTPEVRKPDSAHGSSSSGARPPAVPGIQAAAGEILLAAGEQLVVTPEIVAAPKRANVAAATAWTRRSLVFDSSPLTEVAQEFNRYNARKLVIDDPLLADFHVSGVFSSVEPTLLLRFLRNQPELVVEETETEIRIRKK